MLRHKEGHSWEKEKILQFLIFKKPYFGECEGEGSAVSLHYKKAY
jgi:hypothetical protein